jgi:hypothetical protein
MCSLDGLLADEGTEYWQFCFGLLDGLGSPGDVGSTVTGELVSDVQLPLEASSEEMDRMIVTWSYWSAIARMAFGLLCMVAGIAAWAVLIVE